MLLISMSYARQTELSDFVLPNNCWIIAQIVLISKVDFETEVGLIIVLQWHIVHELSEMIQNKGHYAIQGHRSPILVPMESSYTTSY